MIEEKTWDVLRAKIPGLSDTIDRIIEKEHRCHDLIEQLGQQRVPDTGQAFARAFLDAIDPPDDIDVVVAQ